MDESEAQRVERTFTLLKTACMPNGTEAYQEMLKSPVLLRDLVILLTLPEAQRYRRVIYALATRLLGHHNEYTGCLDDEFLHKVLWRLIELEEDVDMATNVAKFISMLVLGRKDLVTRLANDLLEKIAATRDMKLVLLIPCAARMCFVLEPSDLMSFFSDLGQRLQPLLADDADVTVRWAIFTACNPWATGWMFANHPFTQVLAGAAIRSLIWLSTVDLSKMPQAQLNSLLALGEAAEKVISLCLSENMSAYGFVVGDDLRQELHAYFMWAIEALPMLRSVWQPFKFPSETLKCLSNAIDNSSIGPDAVRVNLENLINISVMYGVGNMETMEANHYMYWADMYDKGDCERRYAAIIFRKIFQIFPGEVFTWLGRALTSSGMDSFQREVLIYYLSLSVKFVVQSGNTEAVGNLAQLVVQCIGTANDPIVMPAVMILASKAVSLLQPDNANTLWAKWGGEVFGPVVDAVRNERQVPGDRIIIASAATVYMRNWIRHTKCQVPFALLEQMQIFSQVSPSSAPMDILKLVCTPEMSRHVIGVCYIPEIQKILNTVWSADTAEYVDRRKNRYVRALCHVMEISNGSFDDKSMVSLLGTIDEQEDYEVLFEVMHSIIFSVPDRDRMLRYFHWFIKEFSVSSVFGADSAMLLTEMSVRLDLSTDDVSTMIDFIYSFAEQSDIEVTDLIPVVTCLCRLGHWFIGAPQKPQKLPEYLVKTKEVIEHMRAQDRVEYAPLYCLSIIEVQLTQVILGLPFDMDSLRANFMVCCQRKAFVEGYYHWLVAYALTVGKDRLAALEPEKILAELAAGNLTDPGFYTENRNELKCATFPVLGRLCGK